VYIGKQSSDQESELGLTNAIQVWKFEDQGEEGAPHKVVEKFDINERSLDGRFFFNECSLFGYLDLALDQEHAGEQREPAILQKRRIVLFQFEKTGIKENPLKIKKLESPEVEVLELYELFFSNEKVCIFSSSPMSATGLLRIYSPKLQLRRKVNFECEIGVQFDGFDILSNFRFFGNEFLLVGFELTYALVCLREECLEMEFVMERLRKYVDNETVEIGGFSFYRVEDGRILRYEIEDYVAKSRKEKILEYAMGQID
jgi:hypothetical protein